MSGDTRDDVRLYTAQLHDDLPVWVADNTLFVLRTPSLMSEFRVAAPIAPVLA